MSADFVSGLTLGSKLGNGCFGEVYLGQDPAHGRVAVKVLQREAYHDDVEWLKFKSRYIAEARNLSKATHRNVVQIFHVVETPDGNNINICMAFCPGGSLQGAFEKGPMPVAKLRKVATEVLMGLEAMHTRGMIHRDIKPANLLIDAAGVAQISDFGLVTEDVVFGYASQAGYLDHLAFEVWHGKGTSVRSDIWALGMTLYRLLHGKQWYDELPSPGAAVRDGGFVDRLKWLPHIGASWRRFLRKMLHDDPSARYQTAAQALSALSPLSVEPIWALTVSPALVRWERVKGERRIVVEWKRHSPRKHEWKCWSEPLTSGRNKTLAQSEGVISNSQAIKEIEAFFATSC